MKFTVLAKNDLRGSLRSLYVLYVDLFTILKCSIFRSSLDLRTQIRWEFFHMYMKFMFIFKNFLVASNRIKVSQSINQDFKRKGFVLLGRASSDSSELSAHVESLFLSQSPEKYNVLPRKYDPVISNHVFKILTKFSHSIESIFQSHFQTYWISVYKTSPGESTGDSSFVWHQDADPRPLLKIFIYLNDVTKKNGAFRTFDRKFSRLLFNKGFISNSPEHRINSQKLITEDVAASSHWIEGSAGTVFIFDNNLIHKGTFPEEGYRTVISIEIYPSKNKLDSTNVANPLSMPVIDDFPLSPYINRYMPTEQAPH